MAQWQVSVPSTLSAGEFAPYAGCTDPSTKVKETYVSQLRFHQSETEVFYAQKDRISPVKTHSFFGGFTKKRLKVVT